MTHAHHDTVRALVAEVRRLRDELSNAYETLDDLEERHSRRARTLAEDRYHAETQAAREREDRRYAESQRERALRDLERARNYGDDYAERHALDQLRRLT